MNPTAHANSMNDYSPIEQAVRRYEADGTFSRKDWQRDAKVSVIVTTYNQEDQLRKQLLALTQQTYDPSNFEVIVVDDGGKRGSGSSLDSVVKKHFPVDVKYVWQPDNGFRLAKARNEALKRATYDMVISIDCDMIVNHRYIEDVMKWQYAAKKKGVGIVTIQDRAFVEPKDMDERLIREKRLHHAKRSPSRRFGTVHDWRKGHYDDTNRLKRIPPKERGPVYFVGSMISGGNCSFSKADAFEAGLFDESFTSYGAEDTEFGIRLYDYFTRLNERRFFIPVNTTAYHIEHGSSMASRKDQRADEFFQRKVREAMARPVPPRPEVSVYIPCYNQERFIEKAIESVARQKNVDTSKLEVVVGEDGSTDRTKAVLERLQRQYAGRLAIRVISDGKNYGMAENTNRTIRACRGKYILQLDPDDELLPEAVSKLSAALDAHPDASVAFGDCLDRDARTGVTTPHWSCAEFTPEWYAQNPHATKKTLADIVRRGMRIHAPRMFRRNSFYETEGVNPNLENAVDYDLCMKLCEVGKPIHVRQPLYIYNVEHGENTSRKRELQRVNGKMVGVWSAERASTQRRKEVYIQSDSREIRYFDIRHPSERLEQLVDHMNQPDKPYSPGLRSAAVREAEHLVSFYRWVFPDIAREQLQVLLHLDPTSNTGRYYHATFLESERRFSEALREIQKVQGPTARALEARVQQAVRRVS